MPSLDNIVSIAEALETCPVLVMPDRCVAVRNRNASCRNCIKACPVDAITVASNELSIDASACVGCGACCAACPTEALVPIKPSNAELREAALRSAERNDGCAVIACARIASKRQADPESYAEVPCLSRINEILLIELLAEGVQSVLFVDGNCDTCKNRICLSGADAAINQTYNLLTAHDGDLLLDRVTSFPEEMRVESTAGMYGSSRRGFFTDAFGAAKKTATTAAKTTIENELGYKIDERSIGERLRVGEDGTLPRLTMKRHEAALNALDRIGAPESGPIESRLFGSIEINTAKCNVCSMCVTFCPTGALKRNPAEKPSERIKYFEFSAADCVQCGLCKDVCWKCAITLSSTVDASELYDFEPRVFTIGSK